MSITEAIRSSLFGSGRFGEQSCAIDLKCGRINGVWSIVSCEAVQRSIETRRVIYEKIEL